MNKLHITKDDTIYFCGVLGGMSATIIIITQLLLAPVIVYENNFYIRVIEIVYGSASFVCLVRITNARVQLIKRNRSVQRA